MGIMFRRSVVVALQFFIIFSCSVSMCTSGDTGLCIEKERQALLAFRQSVTEPYNRLPPWNGPDCCSWDLERVICNNVTGHVKRLDLSGAWLVGKEVSPSLADLKHLTWLDLRFNNFSSSKIPSFFGNFKSLRILVLSDASFAGLVPSSLGNLSTLQQLYLGDLLDDKRLLKIDNLNWLSQLSALDTLYFRSVDLSQVSGISRVLSSMPLMSYLSLESCGLNEFPFPLSSPSYANLTNLKWLDLIDNNFSGQLPACLAHLPSIQQIDLAFNSFSGSIPSSYFTKPSTLRSLMLGYNKLNGTIPESVGQLSSLQHLLLENNRLSGIISEIHFDKLVHLKQLDLSSNFLAINVSTDWVPPFQLEHLNLGSLKFENGFPRWLLTQQDHPIEIYIPNAKITGSYHFEDIVPLMPSRVYTLVLSNNSISGYIPQNIGNAMPILETLLLSHNNIGGRIPTSLCTLSSLQMLDLSNNNLYGDLSQSCWSNTSLMEVLDLSSNQLTGLIPSSIGNLSALYSLHLRNNHFFGELPTKMEGYRRLEILDLANNEFSGTLGAWVKRLENLRVLNLRSNKFAGRLVHGLCDISTLQILDLADNNFVGPIPSCFGSFSGMISGGITGFFTSDNVEYSNSLDQVIKGREIEYTTILNFLVNLDLSSNNLEGHIPEGLTFLSGLCSFNLSHNRLTGSIPKLIGNLRFIESLDFSHNQLTGMIPQSISNLTSLAHLNLSYNHLSGKIPTGMQLQTLSDPSIYEGNQGLCGIQIEKECFENKSVQFTRDVWEANEESEKFWVFIGFMVGIVVGFWGVCGVLFFTRTWRFTFFQFVENVYEWLVKL